MARHLPVVILSALSLAAGAALAADQPYAGLENREIKALSPERIDGLLQGQGLSYALAAELNGLPGPRHVLDMAAELNLDATQKAEIEGIFARMNADARQLGADLIDAEARLDEAFASGELDADDVEALTGRIAEIEGRLRAIHLAAHLETNPLLSRHQKQVYATQRGYETGSAHGHGGHGG